MVHGQCFRRAVKANPKGERGVDAEQFVLFEKAGKRYCQHCGDRVRHRDISYHGLLFHDLRRSAVRDMIRAGIPERVAMRIGGWKTRSILDRYNVTSESDLRVAVEKYQAAQKLAREAIEAEKSLVRSSLEVAPSEAVSAAEEGEHERVN